MKAASCNDAQRDTEPAPAAAAAQAGGGRGDLSGAPAVLQEINGEDSDLALEMILDAAEGLRLQPARAPMQPAGRSSAQQGRPAASSTRQRQPENQALLLRRRAMLLRASHGSCYGGGSGPAALPGLPPLAEAATLDADVNEPGAARPGALPIQHKLYFVTGPTALSGGGSGTSRSDQRLQAGRAAGAPAAAKRPLQSASRSEWWQLFEKDLRRPSTAAALGVAAAAASALQASTTSPCAMEQDAAVDEISDSDDGGAAGPGTRGGPVQAGAVAAQELFQTSVQVGIYSRHLPKREHGHSSAAHRVA